MNAINKLFNSLNEFIKADVNVKTTNLSNELFETLKLIENCTSCKKDNINKIYYYHEITDKIVLEKEKQKLEEEKNAKEIMLITEEP